jgi:hypothetical protein
MWEIEAKPRFGLAPTMPTRILLAMDTVSFQSRFILARTLFRSSDFGKPPGAPAFSCIAANLGTTRSGHVALTNCLILPA